MDKQLAGIILGGARVGHDVWDVCPACHAEMKALRQHREELLAENRRLRSQLKAWAAEREASE